MLTCLYVDLINFHFSPNEVNCHMSNGRVFYGENLSTLYVPAFADIHFVINHQATL